MNFVYDFDDTLFATYLLAERWLDELSLHGIDRDEAWQAALKLFPQGFTLEQHAGDAGLDKADINKMMKSFAPAHDRLCAKLLFEDVVPFLEAQRQKNVRQIVLTFGNSDYQHRKLHASGLVDYIDDICIAHPEKYKVVHLREMVEMGSEPIVFIDDNPRELVAVYEAGLPVTLVRMRREGARHAVNDHPFDDDHWQCIQGLEDLSEIEE